MSKASRHRRDASDVAKRHPFQDPRPLSEIRRLLDKTTSPVVDVKLDRRVFNPTRKIPKVTIVNLVHPLRSLKRIYSKKSAYPQPVGGYDVFKPMHWLENPRRTMICLRRSIRRSVLFANRKTGKGGARRRDPRYTEDTFIKCRR